MHLILTQSAVVLTRSAFVDAKTVEDETETALHFSAICWTWNIEEQLIESGTNVFAKTKTGSTPLHFAAMFRNVDAAKQLLDQEAHDEAMDENRQTPLHLATALYNRKDNPTRAAGFKEEVPIIETVVDVVDGQTAMLSWAQQLNTSSGLVKDGANWGP